jgi:phospholipase C
VFHVYDRKYLDRIPRRYTVEAGKGLADNWDLRADAGAYDLSVYGPNGYFRDFKGTVSAELQPEIKLTYARGHTRLHLKVDNLGSTEATVNIAANAYRRDGPWTLTVRPGTSAEQSWSLEDSGCRYDFTIRMLTSSDYERRFAGRMENGKDGHFDPAGATS